ncbi:hypothetical protein FQN54_004201 [Arachnomyces sp. PD_36]|nr:hypothetical protein FQN54_004201 [Arachnomyces sp. PD_36]
MPPDIRSFFGSQGSNASTAKTPAKKQEDTSQVKKRRGRKVIDDSEDDEAVEIKPEPKKAAKKPKKEEPKEEPTTASDYFASSKKGRTERSKPTNRSNASDSKPADDAGSNAVRASPRTKKTVEVRVKAPETTPEEKPKRGSSKPVKTIVVDDEENLGGDDIFATDFKKGRRGDDDYEEEEDEESEFEELPVKPLKPSSAKKPEPAQTLKDPARNGRKRKSDSIDKADEEFYDDEKKKPARAPAKKSPSKPAAKKPKAAPAAKPESKEIQDIFDSIPTVRPPTPPPASGEARKFNYAAHAQHSAPPAGAGTKTIPVGADNCLAGLAFVFTGVQDTLGREEGQSLVKRYGGKVTTAPSSKTSYVVLGADAGPKKLETIQKLKLKTINEDGLFELIRRLPANGGDGKAGEQYEAKKRQEEQKIKAMAAEMEKEDKERAKAKAAADAAKAKASSSSASSKPAASQPKTPSMDTRLWTEKYAPTSMGMICGNKTAVEKLQTWLRNWHNNAKTDFKKPGKDGSGIYRAVIIHGPPGIGKTTAAHLVAKLENYDVVETNASDTRSKKLVENGLTGVLDTTSLGGYFSGEGKKVDSHKKNLVLIMDEVDGMSAGDRGGVGALAAVAKKTRIPVILICNERRLPKMKPFDFVTYDLPFRRPTADQIRARLMTICYREGMKIPPQVLDGLIEGTHADIRQVINMMSTVKLDQQNLDYDKGKQMSKAWEKHVILKPWDIVSKILSAQMFSPSSTSTLNDKIELYFNDHEFSPLMLQENYLRTNPLAANKYQGRERKLKLLELMDNAAESISDGDLVDRMIHGTQQQWSLMPTHAVFSFVRPASFVSGNMTERSVFAGWLGNNSKHGKLGRYVKELQGHMRLRASGDRHEIRQQYLPALWNKLVRPLQEEGKERVDEVIDLMDSYFLTREDWDALVELGLGPMDESKVKLESQTKATFTRLYNQRSHPLPFIKATSVIAPKKLPKEKPDLEDAIDESDEEEITPEGETRADDEEEELDLKKDKYVKVPKAKKKGAAKGAAAKKNAKGKKRDPDSDVESEEPKKARKAGKPKGKKA